jgi:hypothetical protein
MGLSMANEPQSLTAVKARTVTCTVDMTAGTVNVTITPNDNAYDTQELARRLRDTATQTLREVMR